MCMRLIKSMKNLKSDIMFSGFNPVALGTFYIQDGSVTLSNAYKVFQKNLEQQSAWSDLLNCEEYVFKLPC